MFVLFHTLADKDAQKGKKTARKTTRAGGSDVDLNKIAQEQQVKLENEREERNKQIQAAKEAAAAAAPEPAPADTKAPAKAAKESKPGKNIARSVIMTWTLICLILFTLFSFCFFPFESGLVPNFPSLQMQ